MVRGKTEGIHHPASELLIERFNTKRTNFQQVQRPHRAINIFQGIHDPIAFRLNMEEALTKLYQVPRMLVQIVPVFDISPIRNVSTGQACDFLHKYD